MWTNNKAGVFAHRSRADRREAVHCSTRSGLLHCLSREGRPEILWKDRVPGTYSASPLYADGKLYCFNQDGESVVGEPGKEWKQLAVNKLDEGCMATPAIAGKALFVRHEDASVSD